MPSLQSAAPGPDDTGEKNAYHSFLITANQCVCPACGHEQLEAEHCNNCAVNIEEYRQKEKLKKEQESRKHWLAVRQVEGQELKSLAGVKKQEQAQLKAERRRVGAMRMKKATWSLGAVLALLSVTAVATAFYLGWIQL
jgi:hypothetical protein